MKKVIFLIVIFLIVTNLVSCSGIVNYFDELGQKMPTYDKMQRN